MEQIKFALGDGGKLYAPPIDPSEVLDYVLDLTAILSGHTITSVAWRSDYITVDHDSFTDTHLTVWLKSGVRGRTACVTFTVQTSSHGTIERTFYLVVKHL